MLDGRSVSSFLLQAGDGTMLPMVSFVTREERAVAPEPEREGEQRSVAISEGLTPKLPLGEGLAEVEVLADEVHAGHAALLCCSFKPPYIRK